MDQSGQVLGREARLIRSGHFRRTFYRVQADMAPTTFFFASGFATSRACSMKSVATGLSVRFFRVMTPIGVSAIRGSTGKALISGCRVGNRNADACKIVRNLPVAARLMRVVAESVTTAARG